MTELQLKINIVQEYIYHRTGKAVKIIFNNGDNSRELQMLDYAYRQALKWYNHDK